MPSLQHMLPTRTEGMSQLRAQVPHPTLSSTDLLTGFCPGGVGVRVRAASWSPGKGVELGHNCIGAHLGSTVSRGSSPPHKRLAGSSALLFSPLSSMEKFGSWGLRVGDWAGCPSQCMAFSDAPHFCWGVWGRGASTAEPKWQSIGQDTGPDPCSVRLPRDGTFWSPVLIGTLTAWEVPAVDVSTLFSG